jgi:Holliday junction DNA helicase RuvA
LFFFSISGVEVKVASAILSVLTPERFAYAVAAGDYKEIAVAHGVSAKTAQKIILELKDKIDKENIASSKSDGAEAQFADSGMPAMGNVRGDAAVALMALGYTRNEAHDALKGADLTKSLEEIIKSALKNFAK